MPMSAEGFHAMNGQNEIWFHHRPVEGFNEKVSVFIHTQWTLIHSFQNLSGSGCKQRAMGVEIHEVHWGNKWMGTSDLDKLNNAKSRTAGRGLKTKTIMTTSKWQSKTSEARCARLLDA